MEDSLEQVAGSKMLRVVQAVHVQVVVVGIHSRLVVAVSRGLTEVADVAVVRRSDHKDFADLKVLPEVEHLDAVDIREALAMAGTHSLEVLKVRLVVDWERQTIGDCQRANRSDR